MDTRSQLSHREEPRQRLQEETQVDTHAGTQVDTRSQARLQVRRRRRVSLSRWAKRSSKSSELLSSCVIGALGQFWLRSRSVLVELSRSSQVVLKCALKCALKNAKKPGVHASECAEVWRVLGSMTCALKYQVRRVRKYQVCSEVCSGCPCALCSEVCSEQ